MFTTIAIDGPAGSGKSTIGAALARALGYVYFDTGVMYRCVALAALARDIDPEDEAAVSALAQTLRIEVRAPTSDDGRQYTILLDDHDVTWSLRSRDVEAYVSTVAAYPDVRTAMVRQQREAATGANMVMVGRDIGTVVMPAAAVKIYLIASVEERARRRLAELTQRGVNASYDEVLAGVRKRDTVDSQRVTSPLRAADDAVIVDSTGLSIDDVVAAVLKIVATKENAHGS